MKKRKIASSSDSLFLALWPIEPTPVTNEKPFSSFKKLIWSQSDSPAVHHNLWPSHFIIGTNKVALLQRWSIFFETKSYSKKLLGCLFVSHNFHWYPLQEQYMEDPITNLKDNTKWAKAI